MVKNLPEMWEILVQSLGWEDPRRREWLPTSVFLPGEFHEQRSLAGYSPWGHRESDRTERLLLRICITCLPCVIFLYFPGGSDGKESACSSGDPVSIPGLGRSPGEGNGNPPQYSCLENSMDRGVWRVKVHGFCKEPDTTERLSLHSLEL